jgi:hypothetical protein
MRGRGNNDRKKIFVFFRGVHLLVALGQCGRDVLVGQLATAMSYKRLFGGRGGLALKTMRWVQERPMNGSTA